MSHQTWIKATFAAFNMGQLVVEMKNEKDDVIGQTDTSPIAARGKAEVYIQTVGDFCFFSTQKTNSLVPWVSRCGRNRKF